VYVHINQDVQAEKDEAEKLQAEGKEAEAQKIKDDGLDEQARRYFKLMTEGDEKAIAMWQRFRDISIVRYRKTYARKPPSNHDWWRPLKEANGKQG
jgi:arginyl-tRNA synthetase